MDYPSSRRLGKVGAWSDTYRLKYNLNGIGSLGELVFWMARHLLEMILMLGRHLARSVHLDGDGDCSWFVLHIEAKIGQTKATPSGGFRLLLVMLKLDWTSQHL
jgi:hypothetical protein